MRTKKRFFLKAAGISLAFVMMFAMAFAACDTGTSNGGKSGTGGSGGTGGTGGGSVPPVSRIFKSANGKFELTITERLLASTQTAFSIAAPTSGEVFYYGLRVDGAQKSQGLATAGTPTWSFTSRAGKEFTIPVSGSGESLTFAPITITADDGTEVTIPTSLTVTGGSSSGGGGYYPVYPPVIGDDDDEDFTKATNVQVYQENETLQYTGSGTVKIGGLTVGSVTGGKLTYTLPSSDLSSYLMNIDFLPSSVSVSPSTAKIIASEGTAELYAENTLIGGLMPMKTVGRTAYAVVYWYFDRACSITGIDSYEPDEDESEPVYIRSDTYSINAKAGWNKIYYAITESDPIYTGTIITAGNITTDSSKIPNLPSDLKWVFMSFSGDTITVENQQMYLEDESTPYEGNGTIKIHFSKRNSEGDDDIYNEYMDVGYVTNGKLFLTFSSSVPDAYLDGIGEMDGIDVSNPGAKSKWPTIYIFDGSDRQLVGSQEPKLG